MCFLKKYIFKHIHKMACMKMLTAVLFMWLPPQRDWRGKEQQMPIGLWCDRSDGSNIHKATWVGLQTQGLVEKLKKLRN
jgi:hypothetical protein